MTDIKEFLDKYTDRDLKRILISNPRESGGTLKMQVRPVQVKDKILFQMTRTIGTQEFHENLEKDVLVSKLQEEMEKNFKQLQLESRRAQGTVLVSKKGKITIKVKEVRGKEKEEFPRMLSHNRTKNYVLKEGIPVPWLIDLGVMSRDGKIRNARYDKFKQLNRFLEFIEDVLPRLPKDREVQIIDFGCGKSYLTFAMYYYLKELKGYDICVTGLDLKTDVIKNCNALAEKYGYDKLRFLQGDIASYEGTDQVDMVVTLHACDTATDYALEKAVRWKAKVILSVPCCQHELNGQISNEMLSPVFSYGILKERMAALITDGLRAKLLEGAGYETQILEFIDMEHTPKNLLIRAVYTGKRKNLDSTKRCMEELHVQPLLARLLSSQEVEAK